MMAAAPNNYPGPPRSGSQEQYGSVYHPQQQRQQQQQQQQQQRPQHQQQQPPPPPLHQQPQYNRPAPEKPRPRSRTFSFRSDKSGNTKTSELVETHAEKEAKRLHSKADPTLAMNEAEPSAVAAGVKSSLASLRAMPHRDSFGNPISDPDRSNPTRSRWERPLDTIRSFEAAIDGGYNRKSYIRSDTESVANWNRRNSYLGNNNTRFPQDGSYGGRPNSFMPSNSQHDLRQGTPGRESYIEQPQGHNAYSNGQANGRQRYSRMASEPQFSSAYKQQEQPNIYPLPNNHRSYETVGSGSGSGTSGEPAGYQTDPTSSDNSSIERVQSPPKRQTEPANDYGIGFSQTPTYQPSAFSVAAKNPALPGMPRQPPTNIQGPPPVPRKDNGVIIRKPMGQPPSDLSQQKPAMGEKRKSWFARRFSRQG